MSVDFSRRQLLGTRKEQAMLRRLAPVWALVLVTLAGPGVRAQIPFPQRPHPFPHITGPAGPGSPVDGRRTAQRDRARAPHQPQRRSFLRPDDRRGHSHLSKPRPARLLWSAILGGSTPFARPVSSNSYMVFGTAADMLHALDRKTGRPIWTITWERSRPPGPSPMKTGSWSAPWTARCSGSA